MRTDYLIRGALPADEPDIIDCWSTSFDDAPALIRRLLNEADWLKTATVAESGGRVRSCMISFDGIPFGRDTGAYLYALCTHPEFRGAGLGRGVTTAAAQRAIERGNDFAFLFPAEQSLADWYHSFGNMKTLCSMRDEPVSVPSDSSAKLTPLSAEEYAALRGTDCAGAAVLRAESVIAAPDGGFFRAVFGEESALLSLRAFGHSVLIQELLPRSLSENVQRAVVAAAARYFGASDLFVRSFGGTGGRPFLLASGGVETCGTEIRFPFPLE